LTRRIEKISSYIEDNEKVIDVGCDKALLSILLAKRGIHSIASDLRENIIKEAESKINPNLKNYITFRVGDGVTLNECEKDYTVVLAGMGSHLILDIIKNSNHEFKKIITISNNNHNILRYNMNNLGYKVKLEEIIKEKNKYYNLIIFERGTYNYDETELLVGINHQNKVLLKEKNEYLICKYKNIIKTIENDENKKELNRKIELLSNYVY